MRLAALCSLSYIALLTVAALEIAPYGPAGPAARLGPPSLSHLVSSGLLVLVSVLGTTNIVLRQMLALERMNRRLAELSNRDELTGLYKRKHYQRTGKGGPVLGFIQSHFEGAMLSKDQFGRIGPHAIADRVRGVAKLLGKAAAGPAAPLLKPAADVLSQFADQQRRVGNILGVFVPFTGERPHQVRLEGGDASSDSYCFPD